MEDYRDYLKNGKRDANERFANSDGVAMRRYPDTGRYSFADGIAAGSNNELGEMQSEPYIITISNTTSSAVTNFNLFNAWFYISPTMASAFLPNGNLLYTGVVVSSAIGNVSYKFLLNQSQIRPFTIGTTLVQAINNTNQLTQAVTVQTADANGTLLQKQLVLNFDPYQRQSNTIINNQEFSIDGSTSLIMTIQPGAVFTMVMYPKSTMSQSNALSGDDMMVNYAPVGVVRHTEIITGIGR